MEIYKTQKNKTKNERRQKVTTQKKLVKKKRK